MNMNAPDDNPKTKYGLKKPSMFNVPSTALFHLMRSMMLGASKYGPYNWRDKNVSASIYYDAAMRHLIDWLDGNDYDDDGYHNLGAVMACCAILIDADAQKTLNDNRPQKGKFRELTKIMINGEDFDENKDVPYHEKLEKEYKSIDILRDCVSQK